MIVPLVPVGFVFWQVQQPTSPTIPTFTNNNVTTYLTLAVVRLRAGTTELILDADLTDCRADDSKCGYCKCILGKCRVTEMLSEMAKTNATLDELQKRLDAMNSQISELQTKVDDLTAGEIVATGQCGENIYYVLYDNGKLLLRGTGATYDYTSHDSVFYQNDQIKEIVFSNGITGLGDRLFYHCSNAKTVSLPATLTSIGECRFCTGRCRKQLYRWSDFRYDSAGGYYDPVICLLSHRHCRSHCACQRENMGKVCFQRLCKAEDCSCCV